MALYELTVVKLNGETETRYTDLLPQLGGTVAIDGRRAEIVSQHHDVSDPNARERFVCTVRSVTPRNPS